MSTLYVVATAAHERRNAEAALVEAVRDALAAGETHTDVANAAQVTRQTIYRWVAGQPRRVPVVQALDDALEVSIAYALWHDLGGMAAALRGSEVGPKARRVQMALGGMSPSARAQMDEQSIAAMALGARAAAEALKAKPALSIPVDIGTPGQ